MEAIAAPVSPKNVPHFLSQFPIREELTKMYEETRQVLEGREAAIQHDRPILNALSAGTLSIPEAWELLSGMESDTLRYFAAKEFILSLFDGGTVDSVGDNRIRYSNEDTTISFPGPETREQRILVSLSGLYDPLTQLRRPQPLLPDNVEMSIITYTQLRRENGPIPERVRTRFCNMQNHSRFSCYLFYFFYMHPKDVLKHRTTLSFWEDKVEDLALKRSMADNARGIDWMKHKEQVKNFYFGAYQKLKHFKMPVYLGTSVEPIIVEQAYSMLEA